MNTDRSIIRYLCKGLLGVFVILSGCATSQELTTSDGASSVSIGDQTFSVEVAQTPETRAKGLMKRTHLPQDHGMLFIFPREGTYSFWMKNTLISLDIIWISEDQKVVHVHPQALPCPKQLPQEDTVCPGLSSTSSARYVLEVNGGTFEGAIGDQVTLENIPTVDNRQ